MIIFKQLVKTTIQTSNGNIDYDYLVLALGIDFEGGNYRCLPAPYERACLIAEYFKKEGIKGKVILLDENNAITIKAQTFGSAFYPHVRGGKLLEIAGVAKDSPYNKLEGNMDPFDNSVIGYDNIFVTGDARSMAFSKSGNTSNSEGYYMGKVIAGRMAGKKVKWESALTVCYSAISVNPDTRAVSVSAEYAYDEKKKAFGFANASMNEEWRGKIGKQTGKGLHEWAKGMYRNMFSS